MTVAAQIVAAEASGGQPAGPEPRGTGGQRGRQDAGPPSAADGGRAVGCDRAVGRGRKPRHDAAAGGPARMPALWGWVGAGPGRAGGGN